MDSGVRDHHMVGERDPSCGYQRHLRSRDGHIGEPGDRAYHCDRGERGTRVVGPRSGNPRDNPRRDWGGRFRGGIDRVEAEEAGTTTLGRADMTARPCRPPDQLTFANVSGWTTRREHFTP